MNIYIELWKAKETWLSLSIAERQSYMANMQPSIKIFLDKGSKIKGWGRNNKATDQISDYSWYAIWEFPNEDLITEFEALLQGAKWYDYFDQVNICGENLGPEAIMNQMVET